MALGGRPCGRLRLRALFDAPVLGPGTLSCGPAEGEGREGLYLLVEGKLVWGRTRATDVGGRPAKTALRVQGSDAYVTRRKGIRETMRTHASSLHTVTPRGSEL